MASNKKEAAGWGFRLVAVVLTLGVLVGVFAYAFSSTGNEPRSMLSSAIPFVSAVVVSYVLTRIDKIAHKGWQIYVVVLLLVFKLFLDGLRTFYNGGSRFVFGVICQLLCSLQCF